MGTSFLIILLGALMICFIGYSFVRKGLQLRDVAQQVDETPRKNIAEITDDDELVEVHGKLEVHPDCEPLDAPVSENECVYRDWSVRRTSLLNGKTISEGSDSIPFRVTDDTGSLTVDPSSFDTMLIKKTQNPLGQPKFPYSLLSIVEDDEDDEVLSTPDGTELDRWIVFEFFDPSHITEEILRPGDEVYVYGEVHPAAARSKDSYIIAEGEDDSARTVLSNYSPEEIQFQSTTSYAQIMWGLGFIGIVFLPFVLSGISALGVQIPPSVLVFLVYYVLTQFEALRVLGEEVPERITRIYTGFVSD